MTWRPILLLAMSLAALTGCPSPATPPNPPAEIPSLLTIPRDLTIGADELSGSSAAALKAVTPPPDEIGIAIQIAGEGIEEANLFLDLALSPISGTTIPVGPSVFNFENTVTDPAFSATVKFDFGRFDLDGDGVLESCSGCTCPLGCAPDLAVCPTEAPEADLRPICFRIWLDGERFMAGVFDRVPTEDNPQSGRFRMVLPSFGDLAGSPFGIAYDHHDANDRQTELAAFFKDTDVDSGTDFFANRRTFGRIEGPAATAKKTSLITTSFLSPPAPEPGGLLRFQGEYFAHLDFIALETLADGIFGTAAEGGAFGAPDITPPICAQISTANPVSDILCQDLGLTLTAGEFLTLPDLSEVHLPPPDQFPEAPTF